MQIVPLHAHHPRTWHDNRYLYPVLSRRSKGLSLGINLNPDGVCNFDCVYCCVDRESDCAAPAGGVPVDVVRLRRELRDMLDWAGSGEVWTAPPFDATPVPLRRVNDIAFSGNGEPTACLQFQPACEVVADELRAAVARFPALADARVVLITNATLLTRPNVTQGLSHLDRHVTWAGTDVWAKLDAGTDAYYRTVDRTTVPLAHVLENIRVLGLSRPITIQSMFVRLGGSPPPPAEIDAYLARLHDLTAGGCRLRSVQIYTLARPPAANPPAPRVEPLTDAEVDAIVAKVRALGLHAEGFYGVS